MDRHKASWILEFVLRQPIEDWLAKEIILRLPAPTPLLDPHLKKTLFIRRLSSDLSAALLSDRTLHSLELLEELDRSLGAPAPHEALKAAYCAVAAELTVAPLRGDGGRPVEAESEFLDAADRIWNCRVADLERSDARGLVGEALREWRREVEDAVAVSAARGRLLQRDTRGEAEAALREYLRVALEDMGPPLLELVAGAVGGEIGATSATGGPEILPVQGEERLKGSEQAGQREWHLKDGIFEPHLLPTPEVNKVSVDQPEALVNPLQHPTVSVAEIQNGMGEAPADPNGSGRDQNQADMHVEKDARAPASEEAAVVECQRGMEHAEMIQRTAAEPAILSDSGHNQDQVNIDMAGPSMEKDAQATPTKGTAVEDQQGGVQPAKVPRISLMERNPTAHTRQWDEDSNESLSERSADSSKRPHLPTPTIRRVSPLNLYKDKKYVRKRKIKRWTPQEEDALREAVKKHGVGNWKFILQHSQGTFEDRTEVDLKDKWRNMSRFR